jgi:two-component system chemotaxis response regulator CheB
MSLRRLIRVLAVDDSAVVRQVMTGILNEQEGFATETASDPLIAQEKIRKRRPDVVVLDLEMPRMDGMTFLRQLMRHTPLPVIICSGLAGSGTAAALKALEEGAVSVIAKPSLGVREFLQDTAIQLADEVRAAAASRRSRAAILPQLPGIQVLPLPLGTHGAVLSSSLVVIGASTGGTEAIRCILSAMPVNCPPLVITQHMPAGFTTAFAGHLNRDCAIEVREAQDGDRIMRGRALIAPGNLHMSVVRDSRGLYVKVEPGPLVSRHRPSVDVLMISAARNAGLHTLGVLLTGMGRDGVEGLLSMHEAGARTIAQDEASSVVFGMPKEAIAAGAADEVLPLSRIASRILHHSSNLAINAMV